MATIRAADHRARGRVESALEQGLAVPELVVAWVLVEDGGHHGVAEDLLADAERGGCAEALGKGFAVGPVVWTAVGQMSIARGRQPAEGGERGDRLSQAQKDLVAGSLGWCRLARRDEFYRWPRHRQGCLRLRIERRLSRRGVTARSAA